MSKNLQLQIPEPCHEDWDKMIPGDKGHFCDSCQKTVHDFTGMSDAQLIAFFKKPSTGSVCGRFYDDQLNRDFEIPRKRIPWLKYFFLIAVPTFLFSSKAKSQGSPIILGDTVKCESPKVFAKPIPSITTEEKIDSNKITGKVVDSRGQALPSATVMIKGNMQGAATTINGSFKIKPDESWEKITLVISYVGFETQEIIVNRSGLKKEYLITLSEYNQGQVVYVGFTIRKKKPSKPLIQRIFKDTTFKFFKVYPNPVVAGASVNIELKKAGPGEYNVDLINMSGQVVYSGVQLFEFKKETNSFKIPYTITGSYLLQLTNKESGKKHTEKMVIQ